MDICFRTNKLRKLFSAEKLLTKAYGDRMANVIKDRMAVLEGVSHLASVPWTPPVRLHQLSQNRDEQFAVDLVNPNRLVFEPYHDPIPRMKDGGIDLQKVTAIKILEVTDYHKGGNG